MSNNNHSQLIKRLLTQFKIIRIKKWKFVWAILLSTIEITGYILTIIATVLTIAQVMGYKIDYNIIERNNGTPIPFIGFVLLSVIFIAFVSAVIKNWPSTVSSIYHKGINIIVECCNLFEQNGLKVIHTTDTFDMDRIKPKSVVGQFVSLCSQIGYDLKGEIKKNLPKEAFIKTDENLPGLKERYLLGTVCKLKPQKIDTTLLDISDFCLVAFSHIVPGSVKIEEDEYKDALSRMWKNLSDPGVKEDDIINVTVIGNKFLPIPDDYSITLKISLMLETFFEASRKQRCCNTLRICIHADDMAKIDFSKFDSVLQYLSERSVLLHQIETKK